MRDMDAEMRLDGVQYFLVFTDDTVQFAVSKERLQRVVEGKVMIDITLVVG